LSRIEKAQSSGEQSRIVPSCTEPAQFISTSKGPCAAASCAIAAWSRTSRRSGTRRAVAASSPELRLVDVGGDHRGTFRREGLRDGTADPLRRRRDEGFLAAATSAHCLPPLLRFGSLQQQQARAPVRSPEPGNERLF
jgi:hypothetical protein